MTTNISLRIPLDLIVASDIKLTRRGNSVRSVNELVRTVLLEFCSDQAEVDDFAAYKYYERKFKKVRQLQLQSQDADLMRELAKEVRTKRTEE